MMIRREILGRYQGSLGGVGWSLVTPILMLIVYTFVFSVVFNARWGNGIADDRSGFAVALFVGMILHGFVSECLVRAPGLIIANANLVKKVVFPLQVLPLTIVGSALFHAAVNVIVLTAAMLVLGLPWHWTALQFPLVLLPLVMAGLGVTWCIASLGVYLRDIAQVTGLLSTLLLFLSPVFYPQSALPDAYRGWLNLNPLTWIIESARDVLLLGRGLDWPGWLLAMAIGFGLARAGYWWFQRTRNGFADVL